VSAQAGPWRGLALLALCTALGADEGVRARAFEVHHRPLADAADLVSPLLSEEGTLTLRPRLQTLVVEDRPAVLERVAALLDSWDLPPRNAEVTLSLFLGTDRREEGAGSGGSASDLSREVRGVLETLADFTKWTSYEPLGSRSVTGAEGAEVVARLSDEFRVVFVVESVHESQGLIKFRWFTLQRVRHDDDGAEQVEDLYRTGMSLSAGRLHVVGAAADPNSQRALFLTLQARPR
jgi:hypothetical protein